MGDFVFNEWQNGEQSLDGKIALVRKNVSLSEIRRLDYPYELIVHLVYDECQSDGLPASQAEIDLLDRNEQKIANYLCRQYGAKFALCVTSDGVRDQFLYLPRLISDDVLAGELETLSLSVDYDFGTRKVSDWDIYDYALSEFGSSVQWANLPWWKKLFRLG